MRTLLFALLLLLAAPAAAQQRVDPDRLGGVWLLQFDLDTEDAESAAGRIALKALGGLLDEIQVRFAFHDDGRLAVMVDAFGDKDDDWSTWSIRDDGYLILGDNDHFNAEDAVWAFDGDQLVAYEVDSDGKPAEVKGLSMVRTGA